MAGISNLGIGTGYVYVTAANGTSIVSSIKNVSTNVPGIKQVASNSRSVSQNLIAVGTITVNSVSGSGSVTNVDIDSINQIASNVSYTVASSVSSVATTIASRINSHTPSGNNYTARAYNGVVYVYAPVSAGSDVNGLEISVSDTGNIDISTTDIDGGSDSTKIYDETSGYRFFINSDSDAVTGDLTGATEITNYLVPKAMNSPIDIKNVTIANGQITIQTRNSAITRYAVSNEGAAATDTLSFINAEGFVNGDILILTGDGTSSYFMVSSESGAIQPVNNNVKIGSVSYANDVRPAMLLHYQDGVFYEMVSGQTKINKTFQTLTDGATITFDVVAGPNARVYINGNRTLSITNQVNGDSGILIVVQGSDGNWNLTFPANSKFKGGPFTLSQNSGHVDVIRWFYNGSNFYFELSKDFSSL